MSGDEIELDRRFYRIAPDEDDDVEWIIRKSDSWSQVLTERCAVILGEAGTGKTTEFRRRRRMLAALGCPSFFLAVEELADTQVSNLLSSEDEHRYSSWADADTIAYFFLDAVDEARLRNPKSLPSALRNLVRGLRGKLVRTRILISCRVSDWRARSDRREIHTIVLGEDPKLEVAVFEVAPLVEQQLVRLAEHLGLRDVGPFLRDVERAGAYAYLERPRDVAWLVGHWRENGSIGTYTELIASNVDRKLREHNPDRRPSLTPARAKLAATALAGLATIRRKSSFAIPDGELDAERSSTTLEPSEVLPDLTRGEIAELLTLPLFDEATYGRVRIHHRSVAEYLTARWLSSLIEHGLPVAQVERLLFQLTPDGPALPPELVQAAAWLAAENAQIRERVLTVAPLALLEGGDPNALPEETKHSVLQKLGAKYEGRKSLFKRFDRVALRRLASSDLARTINALLLAPSQSPEFLETLTRIVIEGKLAGCADAVHRLAVDSALPARVRAEAIEAVSVVGSDADRETVVLALLQGTEVDPDLTRVAVEFMYPAPLSISRFLELLRRTSPHTPYWRTAYESTPRSQRAVLVEGLLELLAEPGGHARRWLLASFADMVANHAREVDDEIARRSIGFLDALTRGTSPERRYALDRELKAVSEVLQTRPHLRRFLFWEMVGTSAQGRRRPTRNLELLHRRSPLWRPSVADLDWLEDDAMTREHVADRLLAFDTLRSITVSDDQAGDLRLRMERLATHDPAIRLRVERRARWSSSPQQQSAWERQARVENNRQQREHTANLASLRARLDAIRRGESSRELIWLWNAAPRVDDEEGEQIVRDLAEKFDAEIAEAAQEGWRRSWRTIVCPLPHEKKARNTVSDMATIGLAGIAADLRQGLALAELSADEAMQAARLATHTMNRFPSWVDALVQTHPVPVRVVFDACIRADYATSRQDDVLAHVSHGARAVIEICAPVLEALLVGSDPADHQVLAQVLRALYTHQPSRSMLALLAPARCAGSAELERFTLWWCIWVATDPDGAVEHLAGQAAERVLAVCERITSLLERGSMPGFALPERARPLAALHAIVLDHVRPSDDVRRRGAFSPTARDHAERVRALLLERLVAIPGAETVDALLRLADDPRWPEWRDRFLSLAEQRREDDVSLAGNDIATKLLDAYRAHGLAAPAHLAKVGLRDFGSPDEAPTVPRATRIPDPVEVRSGPAMRGEVRLTVLYMSANSDPAKPVATEMEHGRIVRVSHSSMHQAHISVAAVPDLDLPTMLKSLRLVPSAVVHFSGHGQRDGSIVMKDHDGVVRAMDPRGIAQLLLQHRAVIRLVVLNTCYSAALAELLVAAIPCVVGMTREVHDDAAILFAQTFYSALFDGRSVGSAFNEGAGAVRATYPSDAGAPAILVRDNVSADELCLIA